jgi:hypothetical protein
MAGWLLFLRAQTELRAQAARQSLTGELEELRQTIDALLRKLAEDAARAEARIEARLRELERYTPHAPPTEPTPLTPTALPKSVDAHALNPPSPPLSRGERAGSGGILQAQELVDPVSATATTCQADSAPETPAETLTPDSGYNSTGSATSPYGAVRMLAEQGLTIAEIARQTGYAHGEVELILNLTRHRTEENE